MQAGKTLNLKGSRTTSVTEAKRFQRCPVFIVFPLTGEKLRPYLVFKGNLVLEVEFFQSLIIPA